MKKIMSVLLTMLMMLSLCCGFGITASAAQVTVSLPYKTLTIAQGKSYTITPTVKGKDNAVLVWSSSDKAAVSVTSAGKISGVKKGSATVTVKVKGTDATASMKVTVGTRVTAITVDSSEISLKKGSTYTINPTVTPSDASNKTLSYSSSDKSIATVSGKGVITAVKSGTAKITVKSTDGSGKKTVITVKVTASGSSSQSTVTQTSKPSNEKTSGTFNKNVTPAELVKNMKIGWNLGNSLDAIGGSGLNTETSWGNPKTTQAMIDDIKKMGFNTVRIPVSWSKHADENGNIDKEWMDRVKEVVDYAYDNNMYVILNSHHDNAYYDIGGCVKSNKTYEANAKKMSKLWTNIAKAFKNYNERLVFETLNEPKTEGSAKEWSGGTPEERKIVEGLNSTIVSAIRKTGGNNAYRLIMVPAYAATSSTSVLRQMNLPDDDRIAVSVHAYSPYYFAMYDKGSSEFTDKDKKDLEDFFADLNTIFVSKGTPVVIGEFGAINKGNDSDRIKWAQTFVSGTKQYGISCVVWDNNSGTKKGNECFGLYDRYGNKWNFPEYVKAMVKAAK